MNGDTILTYLTDWRYIFNAIVGEIHAVILRKRQHDCRLTGDAPRQSVYLGRPWRNHAKVAFLDCWMGDHIKPEGWDNWDKPESEQTARYCEYNSSGPGAAAMDQRAAWSKVMTPEEAKAYTIMNVLSGTDGWNPKSTSFRGGSQCRK